jgi:acyl-CoA reductase-like NAD-dependent aldehyde dehydrogenase
MSIDTCAATVADFVGGAHPMLIGAEWVPAASGETLPVEDPATGRVIASIPAGGAEDVDRAVRAARDTFRSRTWRGTPAKRRGEILWAISDLILAHADELVRIEVLDNGMPIAMARGLLDGVVEGFRYFAGACTRLHGRTADMGADLEFHAFAVSEPVGVAGLVVPWNGPLASLSNKLAPALAAGCSVVVKPAEQTSLSTLRLAELVLEAGVPPGVVNVVTGTGPAAGAALVHHDDVDKISFTGSIEVGRGIVAASAGNLKRVTLELGGKSPVFVFDDADLDAAIPVVGAGIFANSGQVCFAGSRVYAQPGILDDLVAGLAEHAKGLRVGNGLDAGTQVGPLISERQRTRVLDYVASGLAEGGEVVTGGVASGEAGYFVEPTIFTGTRADMRIVREEIFGPVLTVMPFGGLDELPEIGNAGPYGLGAGVFTRDLGVAHRAVRLLDAGNVWVNCYGRRDRSLPFGGFKQSGWGRENGPEGLDAYLEKKSVYLHL